MSLSRRIKRIFETNARSALTTAGIAVGVFSVVLVSTIGAMGTAQVNTQLISMGVDSLLVQMADKSTAARLSPDDIDTIKSVDGVTDAMPIMLSASESVILGQSLESYIWGVDRKADKIISLEASHGRLIDEKDTLEKRAVAVVDEAIAVEAYGRSNIVGKNMRIYLGGAYHDFEIVGVVKSGISPIQSLLSNLVPNFVYIPYTTMQLYTGRTTLDKIAVKIADFNSDTAVIKQVDQALNRSRGTSGEFEINSLIQQKSQLDGILNTVTIALSAIAGISLLVSGLSIMTAMLSSVGERKREIGIKKSIGAKNTDILREFIAEGMVITLLGSAIGTLAGIFVSWLGALAVKSPLVLNNSVIIACLAVSLAIGLIFGSYPAYKAAKMNPVDALRS